MEKYTHDLIESVRVKLTLISSKQDDRLSKSAHSIDILEGALTNLKMYISNYKFKDESEEITFFKKIKPQLFSQLLYYRKIYDIEVSRPNGSKEFQRIYIQKELDNLKTYFDKNLDLYKYYRSGGSHLDKYYFLRAKPSVKLNFDFFYFERDPEFSTSFDFKITKILANEMLSIYLNGELLKLEEYCAKEPQITNTRLTWTGKKTELIELIYAWERIGCFNNGNTSIKEIAIYIESAFNINLSDYYRTFLEMRDRKGSRTIFLDKMIKYLNDRMDEADNK